MAGHSKWANIKRQKARVDAKKGKTFTQLSRAIIVAARQGSPDPAGNFQLRTAIEKAKAAGIPNDNIERAIAKGTGTYDSGEILEEIRYEGYGPGGIALIMETLTDNRNRTAADLRAALSKKGGNLGETGCVSWLFQQKGVVRLSGPIDEESLLEAAMEGGAESFSALEEEAGGGIEVFTSPTHLEALSQTLKRRGLPVAESEFRWIPDTVITLDLEQAEQAQTLLKLIEALENLDDVQAVTANFELSDRLMEAL